MTLRLRRARNWAIIFVPVVAFLLLIIVPNVEAGPSGLVTLALLVAGGAAIWFGVISWYALFNHTQLKAIRQRLPDSMLMPIINDPFTRYQLDEVAHALKSPDREVSPSGSLTLAIDSDSLRVFTGWFRVRELYQFKSHGITGVSLEQTETPFLSISRIRVSFHGIDPTLALSLTPGRLSKFGSWLPQRDAAAQLSMGRMNASLAGNIRQGN